MNTEYDNIINEVFEKPELKIDGANKPQAALAPIPDVEPQQNNLSADSFNKAVDEAFGPNESLYKQSMTVVKDVQPDRAAKAIQLSKKLNLPADFIERNFDEFDKAEKDSQLDYDNVLNRSPRLTEWLQNPQNASISKDDIDTLAKLEAPLGMIRPYENEGTYVGDLGRAFKSGVDNLGVSVLNLGVAYGLGNPDDLAEVIAERNAIIRKNQESIPDYAKEFNRVMDEEMGDVQKAAQRFTGSFGEIKKGNILKALQDFALGGGMTVGESLDLVYESAIKRPLGTTRVATESLAFSLPSLGLGFTGAKAGAAGGAALGSVVPGIGTAAGGTVGGVAGFVAGTFSGSTVTETGAWINQALEARGYDIANADDLKKAFRDTELMAEVRSEAERKGIATASVDALFSAVGARYLAKGAQGASRLARAGRYAKNVGIQSVGEAGSELAGQVAAYKGDMEKINVGEAIFEGIVSLGHSIAEQPIQASVGKARQGVESIRNRYSRDTVVAAEEISIDAKAAQDSANELVAVEQIGNIAQDSLARQRDPETFATLIESSELGDAPKNVFFQSQEWDEYWASKGESPVQKAEELLSLESYNSAKETGNQISVPLKEYVSKYAGTQEYQDLLQLLTTKPDGMKVSEVTEILNSLPQTMDELATEAQTYQERIDSVEQEVAVIKEDLRNQLREAGRPTIEAERISSFVRQLGLTYGISPREIYDKHFGGITTREIVTPEGTVYSQEEIINRLQENSNRLKEQGFTFEVSEAPYFDDSGNEIEGPKLGEPGSIFEVYSQDQSGNVIGQAKFTITEDGTLAPLDNYGDYSFPSVEVDASYRRMGIATELYRIASEAVGLPIQRSNELTDFGKSFRNSLNEIDPNIFYQSAAIDMSPESRISRAEAMGFDTSRVLYHGTNAEFDSFNPGEGLSGEGVYFFSDPNNMNPENYGERVIEVYAREGKYIDLKNKNVDDLINIFEEIGLDPEPFLQRNEELKSGALARREKALSDRIARNKEKGTPLTEEQIQQERNSFNYNPLDYSDFMFELRRAVSDQMNIEYNETEAVVQSMLSDAGYVGIESLLNQQPIVAIWDPVNIRSTDAAFDPAEIESSNIYKQGERGAIVVGQDQKKTIHLFETADFSTLIHEEGHFYLEVMKDLASQENADPRIKEDFQTILEFLGVENAEQIGVEQHETFARANEVYFREGKAPSARLRRAFNTFKVWLLDIYRSVSQLDVKINDDIRDVFDRMFATQEEIIEARKQVGEQPLFDNPEAWGMPKAMAEKYNVAIENAQLAAGEKMLTRLMKGNQRKKERAYKLKRKEIKAEITTQINQIPVYNEISILERHKLADGTAMPEGTPALKISRKDFELRFPEQATSPKFQKMLADNGLPIDVISSSFNYQNSNDFVQVVLEAPEKNSFIEEETNRRMNEITDDIIGNDEALQQEASDAVHNTDRASFIRMEYDHLAENNIGLNREIIRRVVARPLPDAQIRAEAKRVILNQSVGNIRPNQYKLAERRYAKQAGQALAKGDLQAAFEAKQRELMNYYLYKEASEAKANIDKKAKNTKRFFQSDEKLGKYRDIDFVSAGRAILARYGLGRTDKDPLEHLEKIKSYNPEAYEHLSGLIVGLIENPDDYKNIQYGTFLDLMDTLDSLWSLSRENKVIEKKGQIVLIEQASDELQTQIEKLKSGKRRKGHVDKTATDFDKLKVEVAGAEALIGRLEPFIDMMDLGDIDGPFRAYLYQGINDAHSEYLQKKKEVKKQLVDLSKNISRDEKFYNPIMATELNFEFKNKGQLLGTMIHLGNESNKKKLIVGRQWGTIDSNGNLISTKFDEFMTRMYAEGVITKADWDYVQSVWDLLESIKPMAQKSYKKLYGSYFNEVTASPVETPFGTYKGGYAPATPDRYANPDLTSRKDFQQLMEGHPSQILPTAGGRGFTKSRVENFTVPLDLDIANLGKHIETVLRFAIMKPAVVDSYKILQNQGFSEALHEVNPAVKQKLIVPALNRADKDQVFNMDPAASSFVTRIMGALKTNASMQIMFLNVQNVLEQVGQIPVAALRVSPKYLFQATNSYFGRGLLSANEINELSPYMKTRTDEQIFEVEKQINDIFEEKNLYDTARDFALKNTYLAQSMFQHYLDRIVWSGSYNESLANGMNPDQAIRKADADVRLTQTSRRAFDVSQIETNRTLGFFQMFMSYFNAMYNLSKAEGFKALKTPDQTTAERTKRLMVVYMLAIATPAVISRALRKALSGKLDEDDDGEIGDDLFDVLALSQIEYISAMFPVVGTAAVTGFNKVLTPDKMYDDRMRASPAVEAVAAITGFFGRLASGDLFSDGDKFAQDSRETLNAIGTMTGLPIGPLAKPANYVEKWTKGEAKPTGPIDAARGLVTGKP